jgi:hypothetical protein
MRTRVFFSILLSVLFLSSVTAQKSSSKITITGTVLDESKNPVVNAMIMIDGVKSSSMTDSKGMYKIKVKRTAQKIGIISFGSGLLEEAINGRTEINFTFSTSRLQQQPDQTVSPGEEGVNTGYNYVKKKDMTTPSNKIDGTDKKYASYSSVSEMITRETSGVKYSGGSYIIQDSKDFFGSFDGILPSSVESITVLKGSSASIYGARGYGGAIVLKTKIQNK